VNPELKESTQRKQVEREAAALETDYRRHLITEARKIRLSEVIEEFIETKDTESTKAGYRGLYERRIKPQLGNIYVQDLTPRHLRDFYKYLEKDDARPACKRSNDPKKPEPKTRSKTGKLSGTSRRHYHQLLPAALNFAVKSGYISINPAAAVDAPRQDTQEADFLEGKEIADALKALDSYPEILWRAFFTLDLFTSIRPGEMLGLDWSDLDGNVLTIRAGSNHTKERGTFRTDRPKTKSSIRPIIVPQEALDVLMIWKSEQAKWRLKCGSCWQEPYAMFTNEEGKRLYYSTPTHKWREIQKAYNLKDAPFYSFRHTGASIRIAEGCDVKEVSAAMGHSRASTTLDIYSHLFKKAEQRAADAMSAGIARAKAEAK
jgi:integrase